jgi:uncharacterized phage-associated protein
MASPIFNLEKSLQAVLYVAARLEKRDFHKIFKILYFADREHLAKYGRPITGDIYIKMMNGPVPSNIYDIFKAVKGIGFFSPDTSLYKKLFRVVDTYCIEPIAEVNLDILSESDIEELDESLSKYGKMTFGKIRNLSHGSAWKSAPDDDIIPVENILKEAGQKKDYISYISKLFDAQQSFS